MKPIYLDYNATTPILPEVAESMKPCLYEIFGNPSSDHFYGWRAKKAIEDSRAMTARIINALPSEIIFTSGGTESNNIAITGYAMANRQKGRHIISSAVEHPAVLEVLENLKNLGFCMSILPVNSRGVISVRDLEKAITEETILITIMHSNNETGILQPVDEIGKTARRHGIAFHSDAAQSVGKVPVDVVKSGIDLLSIAGHKLYAPKGVGALYINREINLKKVMYGAGHERNLRPGTENLLEITGLGKACEIMNRNMKENMVYLSDKRDYIARLLTEAVKDALVITDLDNSLPNTLNIAFPGISGRRLAAVVQGIAVSAGSACHADSEEASYVLRAMGISPEYILGALRISVGLPTTRKEADSACRIIAEAVSALSVKSAGSTPKNDKSGLIKLTALSENLGCSCKLDQDILSGIMSKFCVKPSDKILVSNDTSDDSAVYDIGNNKAIVSSVDFFTPVVDDPFWFGQIACANALSDIYAMGAKPIFALNLLCYPLKILPEPVLERILQGALEKAREAGISIIGGHSIEDRELKYGLAVTGMVDCDRIIRNNTAEDGDLIAITKPLGNGIICSAMNRELIKASDAESTMRLMAELNDRIDVFSLFPVNACTDITGFGLLGHIWEMIQDKGLEAFISMDRVPVIDPAYEMLSAGIIPHKTKKNLKYISSRLECSGKITEHDRLILADAQTSGGLLMAFPERFEGDITDYCGERGLFFRVIGRLCKTQSSFIRIER